MTKTILLTSAITAIIVVALLFGLSLVVGGGIKALGAQVQNDLFWFTGGIKVGNTGQFQVDSSGNITNTGTLAQTGTFTLGSGGTAYTLDKCATSSWNPVSVSSSTMATTSLYSFTATIPDAARVSVSLGTTTSAGSWVVTAAKEAATSVRVILSSPYNTGMSAFDIGTTTITACYRY